MFDKKIFFLENFQKKFQYFHLVYYDNFLNSLIYTEQNLDHNI